MRSILRQAQLKSFSTSKSNKLSSIIQQTAQNLQLQNNINYLKYEQIFFKFYTNHLLRQKKVTSDLRRLDALCMMSDFPCRSIVQQFNTTSKNYSEQYVVQTFVRLAKAYKISQADNASTADFSINRLFFTPSFENLIEEFKFGLRKQNAMKWENAFLVAECLIDIGYVDYQVFSILLNMVEARLNKRQRNQNQIRYPQIEKQNYYMGRLRHTQSNLTQDQQFNSVLKMLHDRVKSEQIKNINARNLKDLSNQLKNNEQNQTIYQAILESVKKIQSYNNNLTKLIEAIFTIRKQYRKMVVLSENKQILRNPELNLQLLELQQTLLVKQLINLYDIKNSQKIQDDNLQLKRVEEVLISLIQPQNGNISASEIAAFINTNNQQIENKQLIKLNKLKEIQQYGRAMSALSRLAQVSRRLYSAPDARSLISMKWQKTLLKSERSSYDEVDKQFRENLHPEKIFRRTYVDLYRMMKRSYSIFMFTFIEAPLKYKIQFFESLTRLGFHEQVINLLESQDYSKQKVQQYHQSQFFSLIKVLNEVGTKINAQQLKKSSLKQLKRLYESSQLQENKSLFTMQFCINSINFICQNFNVVSVDIANANLPKDDTQVLYDNLVNRLASQTKYLEQSQNFLINDHLYQAYRILSMQKPGDYKLDKNFYKKYHIDVDNKQQYQKYMYKKNPFYFIINEMCQKLAPSTMKDNHPFIPTGYNNKGALTGVLLCSSDFSSTNGKHAVGNINAYIARIKRQYQVEVTPLMINSLLQIDYDKIFENKQFSFKSKEQIQKLLHNLFKRDQLNLRAFTSIMINITSVLQKHYKKSFLLSVTRFLNSLNQCIRLYDREKQIFSSHLFKFRRYRLYVSLDSLKQDYNMIDKQVKQQIQKLYKKQVSSSLNDTLKRYSSVIETIQHSQKLISQQLGQNENKSLPQTLFEGKRFTIQSFIENQQAITSNIGVQFINSTTYTDKTFCGYKEWSNAISHYYPLQSIKLTESSNLTKILSKKYLPYILDELTLLPYTKKANLKNKVQFVQNSLDPIKQVQPKTPSISEKQTESINLLMSFIHELKISKSQNQLIQYLFSFDFIDQLYSSATTKNQNNQQQVITLPRNPEQYFNYLESRNTKLHIQSPNLDYLFTKLQKNQNISELYSNRKQKRANVKILYQLGQINRKQFHQKLQEVDQQIITALKSLQENVLDHVQNKFLDSGLKMIRIEKDQQQLQRVLNSRAKFYERTLDKDFIQVKGNTQRCLKIKRTKAERQLALYRVLYRLSKGQVAISTVEKEFLKKEFLYVTFRLENNREHADTYNEKFAQLTISDLTKADKQRLKLAGINLSNLSNLSLSDLILEFSNLLDSKVQQNFQKLAYSKHYSQKHNIPSQIFISHQNKQFSLLINKQQKAIVNQHSQLNEYEKNLLEEMVKTFKTQSHTGKQRYSHFYDNFNEDINQMNKSQARVQLISEYLNLKEIQFSEDYNPKLVQQTKQKEVMKLWNIIFKKTYNQCNTDLIKNVIEKLCDRLKIIGNQCPPFLGLLILKILEHPSTDILSKQKLISCVEYYKTPIKIDSEDIRVLGYGCSNQQTSLNNTRSALIEKMGLVSNKNLMENINKKINMIV